MKCPKSIDKVIYRSITRILLSLSTFPSFMPQSPRHHHSIVSISHMKTHTLTLTSLYVVPVFLLALLPLAAPLCVVPSSYCLANPCLTTAPILLVFSCLFTPVIVTYSASIND